MARNVKLNPFTEEQKEFILEHYKTTTVSKLSKMMGHKNIDGKIYGFLYYKGLEPFRKEKVMRSKIKVAEGMFDVMERENWYI